MRKIPTWQTTRRALTATAIAAFVTGGAFLSAGTASAATTLAGTCTGAVNGNMGDTVAVEGKSLSTLVQNAAKKNEIFLHLNGVDPAKLGSVLASRGTLAIGAVPNSAGGSIDGASIASVVTQSLQNEGALGILSDTKAKTLQFIKDDVAKSCGLTTVATNYVAPGGSQAQPGTGAQQGGGTAVTPGGTTGNLSNLNPGSGSGTGTAPMRDYGGIPTATAGTAVAPGVRYPANGTLPGDASVPQAGAGDQSGQSADIRDAGNAQSLSAGASSDVQLPMLLAVIVLAGVTAGLVRTWVLRRAS